ncbi:hypothetical protein HNV08_03050 [Winogradskyella eckloniae]|uniref:hypothetical protein n=1 Tax=Winogradskyella eckloniae TaxID=1089306 RepID=UPI0015664098|nr:hypothetical protein [Winogradskyella eckloniae]NRD19012.1 hypothetical protein [Winogradskyella eckloniae]
MRFIFLFLLFVSISVPSLNAQTEWFHIDTHEQSHDKTLRQVIQVINPETNELVVFFRYTTFIVAHKYNQEGVLKNTFRTEVLPKYKHNYFGTSIHGDAYTLFFQNDYGTKFSALTLNFETSGFQFSNKLNIPLKSETLLGTFEYKSTIYLLSTVKRSSKLKLYKLHNHEEHSEDTFDFSHIELKTYNGFKTDLNRILDGGYELPDVSLIHHGEPTSLEQVIQKNKLYLDGDQLILTNDVDAISTTLITIDLDTKDTAYHRFPKPSFDKKDHSIKSNSFILDSRLYTIYVAKETLDFSVFDINSKALLKRIVISDKDSIAFKNTPIILEGGDFQSYRELDKTKQFLKKVSNSNAGLSVYKNNGNYVVTLGSSETMTTSAFMMLYGGALGGIMVGISTSLLTTNFLTYTKTKSTRIECLFNNDLTSISGTIPKNHFDIINAYIESKPKTSFAFKSIFKANGSYVLGYFDEDSKIYKYLTF